MWQKIKCWLGWHEWIDKDKNVVGWCTAKTLKCSVYVGCSHCPYYHRNKCKHCGKVKR